MEHQSKGPDIRIALEMSYVSSAVTICVLDRDMLVFDTAFSIYPVGRPVVVKPAAPEVCRGYAVKMSSVVKEYGRRPLVGRAVQIIFGVLGKARLCDLGRDVRHECPAARDMVAVQPARCELVA